MAFIEPMHCNKPNITHLLILCCTATWCSFGTAIIWGTLFLCPCLVRPPWPQVRTCRGDRREFEGGLCRWYGIYTHRYIKVMDQSSFVVAWNTQDLQDRSLWLTATYSHICFYGRSYVMTYRIIWLIYPYLYHLMHPMLCLDRGYRQRKSSLWCV